MGSNVALFPDDQICIVYAENGYGLAACGGLFIDYRGFSRVEKVKENQTPLESLF